MNTWTLPIELDARSATPLFLQIARAIAADASRGRLRPGDVLPGSRTFAHELGVHRSTVVAAYAELIAQGWATGRAGHATTIAATSPDVAVRRSARAPAGIPARPGFSLAPLALRHAPVPRPDPRAVARTDSARAPRDPLSLWGGVPDTRLIDLELIGRALRRATRQHGRSLLRYADDPRGHPGLRAALAAMLAATRGLPIGADDVIVTHGSQMALDLAARALVTPGDTVVVEALGYRSAWAAFERAGARLESVPLDAEGLDTTALQALVRKRRVRAIYLTPHHQFPTTVTLSPRRRAALLELARAHGIAIVEDDYDHEFHFDGRPVLPLASADRSGQVIYVGGLAKVLAPGLRIGFAVAPRAVLDRLAQERALVDGQGNRIVEAAVAELLEEGEIQRHVRRVRRIYHERRDVLAHALARSLGDEVRFDIPHGGLTLWVRAERGIDAEAWRARAAAAGVLVQSGAAFSFEARPVPCLRLGYGACEPRELELAATRLAGALRALR